MRSKPLRMYQAIVSSKNDIKWVLFRMQQFVMEKELDKDIEEGPWLHTTEDARQRKVIRVRATVSALKQLRKAPAVKGFEEVHEPERFYREPPPPAPRKIPMDFLRKRNS